MKSNNYLAQLTHQATSERAGPFPPPPLSRRCWAATARHCRSPAWAPGQRRYRVLRHRWGRRHHRTSFNWFFKPDNGEKKHKKNYIRKNRRRKSRHHSPPFPGLFQGSLCRLRGTGTELHGRVPVEAATAGGGGRGALTTPVATRRWCRTTRPGPKEPCEAWGY